MTRWCFARSASPIGILVLVFALAACAPAPILPAPLVAPQSSAYPGAGAPPLPPGAPPAAINGPYKVGLLVPLSGANAALGKAILDAAQLALFQTGGDRLTLVPRDTGGTPGGAAAAARALVAEKVGLILGPLLAGEVEAVKPITRAAGVNVIAFSTATDLAGGNVFLMGFLPRQEIVREVGFAHERGLDNFAALAPSTAYGHLTADALREAATRAGARVGAIVFFDPRGGDLAAAVGRLLPAAAAAPAPPAPGAPPPAVAPAGTVSFDALLLPLGGGSLKQAVQQLRTAGLDIHQVRLLGSGLWDDPSVNADPDLQGGWFAASPLQSRQDFIGRYQATYGAAPPRLASLGFDAAALAAALAKNAAGGPPFSTQAIENPSGFTGVDGLFRFTPNGLVQRGLAVLEVQPQGSVAVSPAPESFQDLAY